MKESLKENESLKEKLCLPPEEEAVAPVEEHAHRCKRQHGGEDQQHYHEPEVPEKEAQGETVRREENVRTKEI